MNAVLAIIPPWQFLVFAGVFGALWGSFANVVIVRWPLEMSVVKPASHCFSCKTPVRPWDNIPIFSYLILRGRCRHCGVSFSPRYMFIEILMALLSVAVMHRVLSLEPASFQYALASYFIWFAFVWALVTIAMIDLSHYLIPDEIAIPGVIVGLAANAAGVLPLGWLEPLVAAGIGYAGLRLLFIDGYRLLTGKPGMGEGDAKLMAMFGAFLGYEGALFALFAGALQGLVAGIVLVAVRRRKGLENEPVFEEECDAEGVPLEEPDGRFRKARIPFGPFLAAGAIEYLFIGGLLLEAYTDLIFKLTFY